MHEPETPEGPITKWTIGNPIAKRAADNPSAIPAAEIDRLLHQTSMATETRSVPDLSLVSVAFLWATKNGPFELPIVDEHEHVSFFFFEEQDSFEGDEIQGHTDERKETDGDG
ncbi:Uncharacterized protein Fot_31689 [Forsythia ovata]|uniref:Uncharacterized protein n=1 Tax=Forsythia ovata TaxID=205694 RepID=A0ABD1T5R4_9LAMI